MDYNKERINKQTMLGAYALIAFGSIIGYFTSGSSGLESVIPQFVSLFLSVLFFAIVYRKGLLKSVHLFSVYYYVVIAVSIWVLLGPSHPLSIMNLVFVDIIIITTFPKKHRYILVSVFTIVYFTFGLLDIMNYLREDLLYHFTVSGYIGISVFTLGITLLYLYNRYFIELLLERLNNLSRFDYLTNVKNSRAFYEEIILYESDYNRYNMNYSIVYVDIDHFKTYNDIYGHKTGDEILKFLTELLRENIRVTDEVYRIGGDEFIIVFKNISKDVARVKMKKIGYEFKKNSQFHFEVGISYGIVERSENDVSSDDLVHLADMNMYHNKQKDKNKEGVEK